MLKKHSDKVETVLNVNIMTEWFRAKYKMNFYHNNFFENFLLRCDNDITLCKQKITKYILYKKIYSQYLQAGDLNDEGFRNFCSSVFSFYMPRLTSNGYRLFIDKVTDDESLFDVFKIIKYYCMQTDLRYLLDGYDNGDAILFDCNNISMLKFIAFIPYFIKSLNLLLEVYPLQLKLLILINTGKTMEILVKIIKFLFLKNFRDVIYIYSSGDENYLNHFSADVLPKDYKGKLPTMDEIRDDCMRRLENYNEWFADVNHKINVLPFNELSTAQNNSDRTCEDILNHLQID